MNIRLTLRRTPRLIRCVLLFLLCCSLLLTVVYGLIIEVPGGRIPGSPIRHDHQWHVLAFSALAVTGAALWSPAVLLVGILIASGGALELVQGICGRDMSLADFAANSAGVIFGTALQASKIHKIVLAMSRDLIGR